MFKRTLPLFLLLILSAASVFSQNSADSDYFKRISLKEKTSTLKHINPVTSTDLPYLFRNFDRISKAKEKFENAGKKSASSNFRQQADYMIAKIEKIAQNNAQNSNISYSTFNLDSAYYYLNKGNKKKAAEFFEIYLKQNPNDTKVRMQLGYVYYDLAKYSQSISQFDYVAKNSKDPEEVEAAKAAAYNIKQEESFDSRAFEMYFYNFYDSYQENYIANLVVHVHFRLAKNFFAGPYLDVYTDTRSTPQQIFNDRFVELGGFFRYNILRNLFFEFRLGYARQFDLDSSQINIKPMIVYFNRFGNSPSFVGKNSTAPRSSFYLDVYWAAMYDYKYRNTFIQIALEQVLRFHTGGYGYIDNYLVERASLDSRRLDYNNYVEVGLGIRFKPDLPVFPVIFLEPTYKAYFFGTVKNSFQIKVGFWFYFRNKI